MNSGSLLSSSHSPVRPTPQRPSAAREVSLPSVTRGKIKNSFSNVKVHVESLPSIQESWSLFPPQPPPAQLLRLDFLRSSAEEFFFFFLVFPSTIGLQAGLRQGNIVLVSSYFPLEHLEAHFSLTHAPLPLSGLSLWQ